jgi:hypothetical protein
MAAGYRVNLASREATVLELLCYLLAVIFGGLATLSGPPLPPLDRTRLLAAAFTCFVIPAMVHAAQHM